jgi:hypothetical protein
MIKDDLELIKKFSTSKKSVSKPVDINRIKKVAEEFKYKKDNIIIDQEIDYTFNTKYNFKNLNEEQFDDMETAYEQLKFAIDIEIKNFALNLLANNYKSFSWCFAEPKSEVFKDSFERSVNRFTTLDQASKEQFINRVKLIFQKIFIETFGINDEERALDMADKYTEIFHSAVNMVGEKFQDKIDSGGTSVDVAQKPEQKRRIDYR